VPQGYSRALHKLSMPETVTDVSGLPTHIDWRTSDNPKGRNVVTPVKDQGGCGSCWSFSSAETIESMVAINTGARALALAAARFLLRPSLRSCAMCARRRAPAPSVFLWVPFAAALRGVPGGVRARYHRARPG
jgi:hypothetical protein